MTDLERVRNWIKTFPDFDILSAFQVDYTDQVPANGGIYPSGMVEVERRENVLGDVTVTNQLNFGLYYVFEKSPGDDAGALINADWIMSFQRWVQEQSIRNLIPRFGNTEEKQKAKAENGVLYSSDEEGTATYMVQLSIQYKQFYGGI